MTANWPGMPNPTSLSSDTAVAPTSLVNTNKKAGGKVKKETDGTSRPRRGRPPKGGAGGNVASGPTRKSKPKRKQADENEDEPEEEEPWEDEGGQFGMESGEANLESGAKGTFKKAGTRFFCDFEGCGRSYSTRWVLKLAASRQNRFSDLRPFQRTLGATQARA